MSVVAGHTLALWLLVATFGGLLVVIVAGSIAGERQRRGRSISVPEAARVLVEEGVIEDRERRLILDSYLQRVAGEELLAADEREELEAW